MFEGKSVSTDEPRIAVNLDFKDLTYRFILREILLKRLNNQEYLTNVQLCLDVLKNYYEGMEDPPNLSVITENDLSVSRIETIESHIQQSVEFFEITNKVSNLTKPLLTYYAHLNIAKALIYSTVKFHEMFNKHGLVEIKNSPYSASVRKTGFYSLFLASLGETRFFKERINRHKNNPYRFEQLIDRFKGLNMRSKETFSYSEFLNKAYVISFILGSVSRYHPRRWQTKQFGFNPSYISEVNKYYASFSEYHFKIAILSFFKGIFLSYTRPSYLTS